MVDESGISASSLLLLLSAVARDRDGDNSGVKVINQGCFLPGEALLCSSLSLSLCQERLSLFE